MTAIQRRHIENYGRVLLSIFPDATEKDPVKLCRKLRRLNAEGAAFALRLCNGPEFADEQAAEDAADKIMNKVHALLNFAAAGVPVFLNRDPRGHALKIEDAWVREHRVGIRTDFGGYGILAPGIDRLGDWNGD